MNLFKISSFLIFVFSFFNPILAQENTLFDWDKVNYGGRIGFDLSNDRKNIVIAPSVVYKITDQFSFGGSFSLGHTSFKSTNSRLYNYGVSFLSYYKPAKDFQLSAELEKTYVTNIKEDYKNNFDFLALYIGVGYRLGRNMVVGIRYDVLYDDTDSLYTSPLSPFLQICF